MFHWQAALLSLTEDLSSDLVTEEHLIKALSIVRPSLNPFLLNKYQQGSSQGKKLFVLWMVLNIHSCSSHKKKIIESSCFLGGGGRSEEDGSLQGKKPFKNGSSEGKKFFECTGTPHMGRNSLKVAPLRGRNSLNMTSHKGRNSFNMSPN